MKTKKTKQQLVRGNTLILTLIATGLIGFLLSSYIGLVKSQNISTTRSQAWNATIPVIEAGIEDALTHINQRLTNDLVGDGWEQRGNLYVTRRNIGDAYYITTISNWVVGVYTNKPIIESRGYVASPAVIASASPMMPMMAAVALPSPNRRPFLARGIRCTSRTDALFSKGLAAKGTIDLKGNDILSDSYNSLLPAYNTGGLYDPAKRRDKGSIATNSGLTNSMNIGNATIYGTVSTGPGGSIAIGPRGAVGDTAYVETPANGGSIQKGAFKDDMNVDFGDAKLPTLAGILTPGSGSVGGTNYACVLSTGNYGDNDEFRMSTGTMMVVGNAILHVKGDFIIEGTAKIVIASGASLTLYVGGYSTTIGGNGIVNYNSNPMSFQYYGLNTNRKFTITGNGKFVGTVYAPNADLTFKGGGAGGEDFSGAAIGRTATMDGKFQFHYDEALQVLSPPRGYVVTGWNEMDPKEVAAAPTL
jgi:hypothetical protein